MATDDWFAAQVWSGREFFCAKHLAARGYEVFLPSYVEYHRWADRVKKVERALFSGYVFWRAPGNPTGIIVSTPGVVRIVSDGKRPLPVARDEIEVLQRVVEARLAREPWQYLQAGQRVRIATGPLRDVEGMVLMVKNRHRLILSVSLLQQSVAVEIDPTWVSVPPEAFVWQPAAALS